MPVLTSREVCQCLRDAALGVSRLRVRGQQPDGSLDIEIDDWRLSLQLDVEGLVHCSGARSPDGRHASLDAWQRYGTNPVSLLSIWEVQQIESLLRRLQSDCWLVCTRTA
jgi:hypothetical protein